MRLAYLTLVTFVWLTAGGVWANTYTDNGNGTVSDTTTGLIWQKQDDATGRTWESALTYCEGLTLGGQTDWRLPNVKELSSLVDDSRYSPAIDPVFTGTQSSYYWSSSTGASATAYAWGVGFSNGNTDGYGKTSTYYVRCVRGQ